MLIYQRVMIKNPDEFKSCDNPMHSYPLVMTNSSPWYRWPIEIDGLPGFTYLLKMVIVHGYVTNNHRVVGLYLDGS